ncbi:MAG: hypothetical protein M3322_11040 [Actinomycetota bacterium]|nr:hypothetical protein [Actinomycetota bacterium]
MRKAFALLLVLGVLGGASTAMGDPNLTLQAQPHRHFLQTPSGPVEIGPRLCDNKDNLALRDAFTQFHANVHSHSGVTGEIGPVAPGLQNPSPAPHITVVFCP